MKQDDLDVKPILTRHACLVDSPFFSAPREVDAMEVCFYGGIKQALSRGGFMYPIVSAR